MTLRNQRGQSLVEYLIIVAILGISSISVIRLVQHSMHGRFAYIAKTLQADRKTKIKFERIRDTHYKKRDLGSFMDGAIGRSKESKR